MKKKETPVLSIVLYVLSGLKFYCHALLCFHRHQC